MTNDPTALQERIAEELYYEQHPEGRHRSEWPAAVYPDTAHECRDLAAAVMSVVAPAIQAAKAEALREAVDTILSRRRRVSGKTIIEYATEYETGGQA